jgi:SAM-dependent methyltransferase
MPTYGDDLAYVHHVGFGEFARGVAPGVVQGLRRAGIENGLVVDVGCGSGILAGRLIDAGYRVLGVDVSPAMIELSRHTAPRAEFRVESWTTFDPPRCRAITALGEILCYRFPGVSGRDLPKFFQRAYRALESGGLLICDITESGLHRNRPPTWRAGDDWVCLTAFECHDRRREAVRRITTFRQVNELYRRSEEVHRLQLYRSREVADVLRSIGFRVRLARHIGDYALLPRRMAAIARKPIQSRP